MPRPRRRHASLRPRGRLHLPAESETSTGPTRTAVILPWEKPDSAREAARASEARLQEAVGLAEAIRLDVVHTANLPLRARRPSTLLGEGQVAAQATAIAEHEATLAIVDAALTPVQQRQDGPVIPLH